MAGVDERELLPTVEPSTNVPSPQLHVQTPQVDPSMFGAAPARATEQLGQQIEQIGQQWNRIAADDVTNQFQEKAEKIRTDFMNLEGRQAVDAQPAAMKALNDLFKESQGKLVTLEQRRLFDNLSRRQRVVVSSQMDTHAVTQRRNYGTSVYKGTSDLAEQGIAANPDSEEAFNHGVADMVYAAQEAAKLHGAVPGDAAYQAGEANAKSRAVAVRALAMGSRPDGAAAALEFAKQHQADLGVHYTAIYNHLHAAAEKDADDSAGQDTARQFGLLPPAPGGTPATTAPTVSSSGGVVPGLSPTMAGVLQDVKKDLKGQGVTVPELSSGFRDEGHNAAVGGAKGSFHSRRDKQGNPASDAIDIPLGPMSEADQRKLVDRLLSDPRVTGFEFEPGHHIHADVGHPGKTIFGSINQWPQWVKDRVAQWRGEQAAPRQMPTDNLDRANTALSLTPQERNLYQRHLDILGQGGIVNRDRSVSTLLAEAVEHDGRWYMIPTIWDGDILDPDNSLPATESMKKVDQAGWDNFPSYATEAEARDRYAKIHDFMDMDTQYATANPPELTPGQAQQNKASDIAARRAAAIRKIVAGGGSATSKGRQIAMIERLANADMMEWQAQEKDKREANEKAMDEWVQKLAPGQPINPHAISDIMGDHRLMASGKENLVKLAHEWSGSDVERNKQVFGKGFYDIYNRIVAPFGDPRRINDSNEILKEGAEGGKLTQAGVAQLVKVLNESRSSVDSAATHTVTAGMLKYGHDFLTFQGRGAMGDYKGLQDPVGIDIFNNQFTPQFLFGLRDWLKEGRDPREYLTKENVEKIAGPLRDRRKMEREALAAAGQASATAQKAADLPEDKLAPVPHGYNVDTWQTYMRRPPRTVQGLEFSQDTWAEIINKLTNNPTPEAKEWFNTYFGRYGYHADTVIENLKKPNPAVTPRESAAGALPSTTRPQTGGMDFGNRVVVRPGPAARQPTEADTR